MTTLKNTLHDSNNGLDYTLVNDRYLPNLTVAAPTEQHPTGRWGRLHKRYLKEHTATHIEDENGKPDLNRLKMLMLKNRLDQWKKEVRVQGYKPLIYINYDQR